jgi:hypothetical protein
MYKMKKPLFKKSEMRRDLPFKKGTVVSASGQHAGGVVGINITVGGGEMK